MYWFSKLIKKTVVGFMVETQSDDQTKRLLTLKWIGDFDVSVIPHGKLNSRNNVTVCTDLLNYDEDKILTDPVQFASQGVRASRKLKARRDRQMLITASHVSASIELHHQRK